MASGGLGIGSFMTGFATMDKMMTSKEDRERKRRYEDEDRTIAAEDRTRRRASEDESIGFQREQRDRQRQEWKSADTIKGAYDQAATDATAKRNADIGKSIQPIEAQGPTMDGKGLPAWQVGDKTFTDQAQAKTAAQDGVKPFLDYYVKEGTPKVTEAYIRAGQPEKAKAYQEWVKNEQVQKGMESWVHGMQAAQMGDADGFAKHISDAYNAPGYFDDGMKAKATIRKDQSGRAIGADIEFTTPDGKVTKQSFDGMESLYRYGMMVMSPEQVFKFGMSQLEATDKARTEIAKENRSEQRDQNKLLFEHMLKQAEAQGPGGVEQFRKRIESATRTLMANDPTFFRLPDQEKTSRAVALIREQEAAAQKEVAQRQAPSASTILPQAMPPAVQAPSLWMPGRPQQQDALAKSRAKLPQVDFLAQGATGRTQPTASSPPIWMPGGISPEAGTTAIPPRAKLPEADEPGVAGKARDIALLGSAGVYGALGDTAHGAGVASKIIARNASAPLVEAATGTAYRPANLMEGVASTLHGMGERTRGGVSEYTKRAIANSTPEGDLLKPSTWTLGKNPSFYGYVALASDVLGSVVPTVVASMATGGSATAGAVVGGLQGGGGAAREAVRVIDEMASTPAGGASGSSKLAEESAYYRQLRDAGYGHLQAVRLTKAAARKVMDAIEDMPTEPEE
ncbi:hypothetical protein [Xanthobacter autotrophicus]|uniref:hypothetical protein n=1 Tax=Xanthobacter autotrophicus TaxID=280 RepID=UPI00372A91EC